MMREVTARLFAAVLAQRFGSGYGCEFDLKIQRFVVITPSATGRPVRQVVVWRHDPNTGRPTQPDVLGLLPFRELDADCQREILYALDKTALTNPHDGAQGWANHVRTVEAHNDAVTARSLREAAELMAYGLTEVDLRRPWLKHHSGSAAQRRIAMGAR